MPTDEELELACRRLLAGVLAQAIEDSRDGSMDARHWLRSPEAALMCEDVGVDHRLLAEHNRKNRRYNMAARACIRFWDVV